MFLGFSFFKMFEVIQVAKLELYKFERELLKDVLGFTDVLPCKD